ncbi:hypothetical protein SARC_00237 [Sphaeroforma arctica JP610]|uniref:Uncharacterized protein n=1 Tax=Sphaeroforma arctica JP610 TaxID=667725 RepID=A0A0L0GFQ3_9EUKA|nr:hypothetical protein SARC_00237 [Sphaeroforma arctica JP610]KNC87666.1 hypothetical protein SARC_00237 [Sphaeroforma arctica JP610]|eukprot:XP_014161568.1 hypothetical protein SARC_00237 [Sphaeroforma arctica JP610]
MRAPISTNTGSHTRHGGAPPQHCTSAGETSARTQQAPGNTFRPRVNLVDGDDQMPDSTPAEVGESGRWLAVFCGCCDYEEIDILLQSGCKYGVL